MREDQLEGVWQVQSWSIGDQLIIENGEVDTEYWQDLNYGDILEDTKYLLHATSCWYSCPLELNFQKGFSSGNGTLSLLDSCLLVDFVPEEIPIGYDIIYGCEFPASYVLSNDGYRLGIFGQDNQCGQFSRAFHDVSFNIIDLSDNKLIMYGTSGGWLECSNNFVSIVANR